METVEKRKSFLFYNDDYELIKDLSIQQRGEIFKAILEYAFEDIETKTLDQAQRIIFTIIKQRLDKDKNSYVYFISDIEEKIVKIGMSGNPEERLKTLQFLHQKQLKIIKTIKTNASYISRRKEKELHKQFRIYRIGGEWFAFDIEIKKFIENMGHKNV